MGSLRQYIDKRFFPPSKFAWVGASLRRQACSILDVGCGNHSPSITKSWFPKSTYTGVDRELYNCSAEDTAVMDHFYQVDLEKSDLSELADFSFDLIIFSHVIEHVQDPARILATLTRKLNEGGKIVIVTPNEKSVNFPSMKAFGIDDCPVNFYDDSTHIRPVALNELEKMVRQLGLKVIRKGTFRNAFKALVGGTQVGLKKIFPTLRARPIGLWDYYGFENVLIAQRL